MTDETDATPAPSEVTEGNEAPAIDEAATAEKAKQTPPEGEASEEESHSDEDGGQEDEDKPRKRSRTDRLKDRIRDLEAQVMYERSRNGSSSGNEPQPPREADFNGDWQAYEQAKIQFGVEQSVRKVLGETSAKTAQEREAELKNAQISLFRERMSEAKSHIPDLEAAINATATAPIRDEFVPFILESDRGPYLAYHLAKNPQQVAELAAMPADRALRELARIEAKLSIPQPKRQTSAPAPLSAIGGGASHRPDPHKMSMDEYVAFRKKNGR